jgi:hypothetical protein
MLSNSIRYNLPVIEQIALKYQHIDALYQSRPLNDGKLTMPLTAIACRSAHLKLAI